MGLVNYLKFCPKLGFRLSEKNPILGFRLSEKNRKLGFRLSEKMIFPESILQFFAYVDA